MSENKSLGKKLVVLSAVIALVAGGAAFGYKAAYDTRLAQIDRQIAEQSEAIKRELANEIRQKLSDAVEDVKSVTNPSREPRQSPGTNEQIPDSGRIVSGPAGAAGLQGSRGQPGSAGAGGTDGSQGEQGEQGSTGSQGPSGIASCPNGSCLSAQPTAPGTQEAGSINIAGKALIGDGIETTTGDFSGQVTAASLIASGQVNALSFLQSGNQVCDASGNCSTTYQAAGDYFAQGGNSFGGATTVGTNDEFALNFETSNTTRMTILADGRVGIGTTSPSYALDIVGTAQASTSVLTPSLDAVVSPVSDISRTNLVSHSSGDLGTSTAPYLVSNVFTPAAQTVLVAYVDIAEDCGSNTPANSITISGGSLDWVSIGGGYVSGGCGVAQQAFYALVDGSPPQGMQVTVDVGAYVARSFSVVVDQFENLDRISPVVGGAFTARGSSANNTFSINTTVTPLVGDWKVGMATIEGGAAPFNFDVAAGWAQLHGLYNYAQESQAIYQTGSTTRTVNFDIGSNIENFGSTAYGGFILKQATSPSAPLTIGGVNASSIAIGNTNGAASLNLQAGTSGILLRPADSTSALQVQTIGGTTVFGVDTTNQRVGIGTTAPGAALHVSGANAGLDLFRITDATASAADVLRIADEGAVTFQNRTDSTAAVQVKNAGGGNIFTIDTTNSRVGINLGSNNLPSMASNGLHIKGALKIDATGGNVDTFVTPAGSPVSTAINIPTYDPGDFGQILAFGVPSTTSVSARALSLFDARTVAHQPTLAVFSPDEFNVAGVSWDGSNSIALFKTSSDSAAINAAGINIITARNASGAARLGVNKGNPAYTLDVGGDINIASGSALRFGGMSAALSVDTNGNLVTQGLTLSGNFTLGGKFIGNADTRGQVTIAAGTTSASYTFNSAYASAPLVVATPTTNPGAQYWVSNVTTTGFTVNLAMAPLGNVVFSFQAQQ